LHGAILFCIIVNFLEPDGNTVFAVKGGASKARSANIAVKAPAARFRRLQALRPLDYPEPHALALDNGAHGLKYCWEVSYHLEKVLNLSEFRILRAFLGRFSVEG